MSLQPINSSSSVHINEPIQPSPERSIPQFEDSISQESNCCEAFFEAIKNCFIWVLQWLGYCLEQEDSSETSTEIFHENIRETFETNTLRPHLVNQYTYNFPFQSNLQETISNQIIHDLNEFHITPSSEFIHAFEQRMENALQNARESQVPIDLYIEIYTSLDSNDTLLSICIINEESESQEYRIQQRIDDWRIDEISFGRMRGLLVDAHRREPAENITYSPIPSAHLPTYSYLLFPFGDSFHFDRSDLTSLEERFSEIAERNEEQNGEVFFTPVQELLRALPEEDAFSELIINFSHKLCHTSTELSRKVTIQLRGFQELPQEFQNELPHRSGSWDIEYRPLSDRIWITFTKRML